MSRPPRSWTCRSPIWRASRAKWSSASPPSTSSFDPGLAELRLEGLAESEAGELLTSVTGPGLAWLVRKRIVAETRGNPLAIIELGEATRQGQGYQLVFADYARCILELGFGHYREPYA